MRRYLGVILVVAAYAAQVAVLYVAVQPGKPFEPLFPGEDKMLHALGFAGLGGLLVAGAAVWRRGWWYATGVFSGFALGVVSEVLQIWVRGRTASVWDWAANATGFFLMVGLYEFIRVWRKGGILHHEVVE